jgi:hypothetical protein
MRGRVRAVLVAGARLGVTRVGIALAAVSLAAAPLSAQRPRGPQAEARLDVIAARTPSLQVGGGLNVPAGLYVRLAGTVGAGVAWRDGAQRGAARADVTARFHLDPFRESALGLYGLAGLSAMGDGFEGWRPRILVGLGVESRARGRRVLAGELSLGGGVRAALVLRRSRAAGR